MYSKRMLDNTIAALQHSDYIDKVAIRSQGRKIGWVASSFDLLHAGHILYLAEAKRNCDVLIAGLQTDPTIDRPEKNKPLQSLVERYIQLSAVKYVDHMIIYSTEEEHRAILRKLSPSVVFKGEDHVGKPIIEDEGLFKFHFIARDHEWSSSELRRRISDCQSS